MSYPRCSPRFDGSFLQFRCDEKGFLGICALGLPGHTHEDDPSRGIQAALDLRQRVKARGHRTCIGVTTGRLLCTCVGARKIRSEYTVRHGLGKSIFPRCCCLFCYLVIYSVMSLILLPVSFQVFGDAINLSARLMVKCKKGAAEILCDEPTHLHAKYRAKYTALEPMQLKVGRRTNSFRLLPAGFRFTSR